MTLVPPDSWRPQDLDDLEPRAWQALKENGRSVYVTAGAGAGKTEFLAQKATYLLQTGICPEPKRILAISFKRDAARNLAERVEKRCPPEQARRFDSVTFDAFTKGFIDRFRAAIPEPYFPPHNYRIDFPNQIQLQDFLTSHGFHNVTPKMLQRAVAHTRLPLDNGESNALRAYWHAQYNEFDDVFLTFQMINRLVDWLLLENPNIRRALQATYPFVFLDEFQDTTYPQFELLHTAFDGSGAIFTAVGDDKQRIMVWAGAMLDAFDRFEADFNAIRIPLVSNWRSHEDLVLIQHVIAQRIDPDVETPEARAERDVAGDIAAIWQYDTSEDESDGLAAWIAREIDDGIDPHDIAILVRMHANNVEKELATSLSQHGVRLRNVVRNVGDIAIQDLLGEDFTAILLNFLRLGATTKNPNAWNNAQRDLQFLKGIYPDDNEGQQRLQQQLQTFVRELRTEMSSLEPDGNTARIITKRVLDFVGPSIVKRAFPSYRRQQDFDRVREGFDGLLAESAEYAASWTEALDQFEGFDQVPLMTIHKSKGLEFHTMIFFGLDSQTWWSLTPNRIEELNSFFVAFTRAKQRAFFTLCARRGEPVAWIENLLAPAGVHRVSGPVFV
ncbi:UvrD-helicase domain-containing protein [Thermodesulfobacteriota bacterium]